MSENALSPGNLKDSVVFYRADLNVPLHLDHVADGFRIDAILPTLKYLSRHGAKVILASHLGRPKGMRRPNMTMKPVVDYLIQKLKPKTNRIFFSPSLAGQQRNQIIQTMKAGDIMVLDNLRFDPGEESNNPAFALSLAQGCDIYLNDAFACCHREHASITGITNFLPSFAGPLVVEELQKLEQYLSSPTWPYMAIVGGAKISSKLSLLKNLVTQVDKLAIVGAMANTFLLAQGHEIGQSLHEPDLAEEAMEFLEISRNQNCEVILPTDVVVAEKIRENVPTRVTTVDAIKPHENILDTGPQTLHTIKEAIADSKTVIWNGALGLFEVPPFDRATMDLAHFIAKQSRQHGLISVSGGGDTLSAIKKANCAEDFSYLSTAGGAFLEWVEGKPLPGIEVLLSKQDGV